MDPEIEAMAAIAEALKDLDNESRRRVLRWASDKFSVEMSVSSVASDEPASVSTSSTNAKPEAPPQDDQQHESFAEFFAAANPTSESEKVLVAGYWVQEREGSSDVTSAQLNKELKHLGHSISHINHKFDTLMGAKPQLAIQLKKSGSSKQARKKYKITRAGVTKVNEMIRQSE